MTKPVAPLASSELSRPGYKVANLERNFFYRYETYPDDESRSVEFKALTKTKQVVLRVMEYSEKYLVAFLNAEGGKTLFGILDDGLIMGLKLSRRTRDEIRLGIDRTVGRIRPVVTNDLYTVKFFPVLDRSVQLEDFFVICLECKKGNNIYVDSKDVAWIRREGSVRSISLPMAKALWLKRMKEHNDTTNSVASPEILKDLIRSTIRGELLKVAKEAKIKEVSNQKNEAMGFVGRKDRKSGVILIDEVGKKSKETKKNKNRDNLIDLEEIIQFSGHKDPEVRKKGNFGINEELIEDLKSKGFKIPKILECLYSLSKTGIDPNSPQEFAKIVASLSKSKPNAFHKNVPHQNAPLKKPLEERNNDFDPFCCEEEKKWEEGNSKASKALAGLNRAESYRTEDVESDSKTNPEDDSGDDSGNDSGNDSLEEYDYTNEYQSDNKRYDYDEDQSDDIFDSVTNIIDETVREAKVDNLGTNSETQEESEDSNDTEKELEGKVDDYAKEDELNSEIFSFFSEKNDKVKSVDGVERDDIVERVGSKSPRRKKKRKKKKHGLFDYINEQENYSNKQREIDNLKDNGNDKNSDLEGKTDKNVEEAMFDEDYFTEEKLREIPSLIYPELKKLFEREKTFKNALKSFVIYSEEINPFNFAEEPTYKTTYRNDMRFISMVKFKIDRVDHFYKVIDVSTKEAAEEIVSKKALCTLEDQGLLYFYNK